MSGAAREAHRRLRSTGMAPYPLEDGLQLLDEIAEYLGTDDPMEIAAGFLLEQAGYERTQVQLTLEAA